MGCTSWVTSSNNYKFSAYQCGYLSDTFINICKCDASDRFVCGPAVDDIYNRVSPTNTPPIPLVTIDAELSSVVIPPTTPNPAPVNTIENGDKCPATVPSTGDTCSNKISFYQCGYLSNGNGNTSNTFIMVCQCGSTDSFVCAPARNGVYSF